MNNKQIIEIKSLVMSFGIALTIMLSLGSSRISAQSSSCPTIPTNIGKASITVTIPETGDYQVWTRIKSSGQNNAYLLQIPGINNNCAIKVGDITTPNEWTWVDYKNGTSSDKIILPFSAGIYTFNLYGIEPTVGIDKLIVTKILTCVPVNTGENCETLSSTPTSIPAPTNVTPTIPTTTSSPSNIPTGQASLTITDSADSFVSSDKPTGNYGLDHYLYVDGSPERVTYIKFNLNQSLLEGKTITDVKLRVKVAKGTSVLNNIVFVPNSSWTESGITYANRPSLSSTIAGAINTRVLDETWIEVPLDIKDVENNIGKEYTIAITHSESYRFDIYSRESSNKPVLVLSYNPNSQTTPTKTYLLGDADRNGVVDLQDFIRWKCELLGNGTCVTNTATYSLTSDFDGDHTVTLLDFIIWKIAFLK